MKLLVLSDLHISKYKYLIKANHALNEIIDENNDIDAVVICGDIFESSYVGNPYKELNSIFGNKIPVICVLGNHEFAYRSVTDTISFYKNLYNPDKYNVHYLDIIGYYDIGKYRFVGNVLWYDGSMRTIQNQNINTFADGRWLDVSIKNFDWKKSNEDCVNQIVNNIGDSSKINILCTHCCPHYDMNAHMTDVFSQYNAFSGMANLLNLINVNYSFCGHTHRRIIGKYIENCYCANVGNDYGNFDHLIIEI